MDLLVRHQKSLTNLWLDLTAIGVACPKLASLALTVNIVEREWVFEPRSPPGSPPADALFAPDLYEVVEFEPIVIDDEIPPVVNDLPDVDDKVPHDNDGVGDDENTDDAIDAPAARRDHVLFGFLDNDGEPGRLLCFV